MLESWQEIRQLVETIPSESIDIVAFVENSLATGAGNPLLFKQILLRYRRQQAAQTEGYRETCC